MPAGQIESNVADSLPALAMRHAPPWMHRAACKGATGELDFWHPDEADQSARWRIARGICAACPVRADCLDYALALLRTTGNVTGMYAALTPRELWQLAKTQGRPTRKQPRHGTRAMYVTHKCRCDDCRAANRRGEDARRKGAT